MSDPAAVSSAAPERTTFARRLGPWDAAIIVISGIVGSGIFVNPYVVAGLVQTPVLILGVWAARGAIALCGAFVFAELATVVPKVGGQYAFFREAFHPLAAFLHGWSMLWIVQSGATAAVAVAFADYLVRLVGMPPGSTVPVAVAVLVALGAFHALGIKPGAVLLNVVTLAKMLALAVLIVAAFALAPHSAIEWRPALPPGILESRGGFGLLSVFLAALAPAMFAYGGWQNVNYIAEEVREPDARGVRRGRGGDRGKFVRGRSGERSAGHLGDRGGGAGVLGASAMGAGSYRAIGFERVMLPSEA